jgi:hypothetical protein
MIMFRPKNAAGRLKLRQVFVPENSQLDQRSGDHGEVYAYELCGKVYAIAFRGSAGKPEWHYSFRTPERREEKISEFFDSIARHQEYKEKRRAEKSAFVHDVKPGDIFRSSWGYDQTNIDYYQCVALIGSRMMEVREIGQQSEETAYMQGKCVPVPGLWLTEADYSPSGEAYKAEHGHYPRKEKAPFRVLIQGSGNEEPYFRVASYANAYRINPIAEVSGVKVFRESHWTAYA